VLPYFLRAQDKAFLSNSSKVSPLSGFPENFESSLLPAFVILSTGSVERYLKRSKSLCAVEVDRTG
jgi:hypothetical protein